MNEVMREQVAKAAREAWVTTLDGTHWLAVADAIMALYAPLEQRVGKLERRVIEAAGRWAKTRLALSLPGDVTQIAAEYARRVIENRDAERQLLDELAALDRAKQEE